MMSSKRRSGPSGPTKPHRERRGRRIEVYLSDDAHARLIELTMRHGSRRKAIEWALLGGLV